MSGARSIREVVRGLKYGTVTLPAIRYLSRSSPASQQYLDQASTRQARVNRLTSVSIQCWRLIGWRDGVTSR
ncbi:MAG: hypothetical protein JWR16_2913 [Nevskia sp.]|nr:hypothetical protein [Nevskia sp.]